jgi:hypothetical protein
MAPVEAGDAEFVVQIEDLVSDLGGAADHEGAAAGGEGAHRGLVHVPPAAAVVARCEVSLVGGVELLVRLLGGLADVEVAGDPGLQALLRVPGLLAGRAVQRDEPVCVVEGAADQAERHRQPELARTLGTGRGSAHGDPDGEFACGARVDLGAAQRRPVQAAPGDRVLAAQLEQEVELLGIQLVELVDVLAEQGERLGEGTAAGDDFGAPVADQVERGEILVDPDGVQHAEHGRSGRERDPLGQLRDRGMHHCG